MTNKEAPRPGDNQTELRRFNSGNIYLIAPRWAGKTTLGEPLAENLGKRFIDLDRVAEERIGMSISEFVSQHNGDWKPFRRIESRILRELSLSSNETVFATGGGVVDSVANIINMRRNGLVVYLTASPSELQKRARAEIAERGHSKPPLLKGSSSEVDEIPVIHAQRDPIYKRIADLTVSTELIDIETEVKSIAEGLQRLKTA